MTFDAEVKAVASAQISSHVVSEDDNYKTTWLQTAVLDTEGTGGKGRK
jgi:hypothetical protein